MTDTTREAIEGALDRIEAEEQVRVVYACESGSRAWGFASEDSDYDVRFIYLRRTAWYLTIQNKRDVIERPIKGRLDVSGWDLRKALRLFQTSNPPLLEWLQSPIAYREFGTTASRLRDLMPTYYSPVSCLHHYLHMAQGNRRQYLQGAEVWRKKYFYVLRPVLACLWIEQGLGVVPAEFKRLVDGVVTNPALRRAIDELVAEKTTGAELNRGPRIPEISQFLDAEIARLASVDAGRPQSRDAAALDRLFVRALVEANGPMIEQERYGALGFTRSVDYERLGG